jgi:hypothetical protein
MGGVWVDTASDCKPDLGIVESMWTLVAALLAACLLAAVFLAIGSLAARVKAWRLARGEARGGAVPAGGRKGKKPGAGHYRECPLCSSALGPGERVKSSIFPGKADRIMHIFGCAHCWPASAADAQARRPRICPVCRKTLAPEAWVVARYFERPDRRHVHVLGCSACRG